MMKNIIKREYKKEKKRERKNERIYYIYIKIESYGRLITTILSRLERTKRISRS